MLVDRLLGYLTDDSRPANLDEFLIITYTKAAASELRYILTDNMKSVVLHRDYAAFASASFGADASA